MGDNTFSKLQKKQYKEIKEKFSESKGIIQLSDEDNIRLREVLMFLELKGYICSLDINGTNAYRRMSNFDSFEEWHKDQMREERKISAREWKIGIIGALIGLIPFIATTVIPWIVSLFQQ